MSNKADARHAARLVAKALQPGLSTANDTEYRELIAVYRSDAVFRDIFDQILRGLELQLLDWSERGIIVVADGPKSLFACRLSDIRSGLSDSEKAALVLMYVSIATVFYPTSESLDSDEFHPPPARIADFRDAVHSLAGKLRDENESEKLFESLRPGWDYLSSLPLVSPKSEIQRAGKNSIVGLIKLALNDLRDGGLINLDHAFGEDMQHAYTPTYRFKVQLREYTLPQLVEYARASRIVTNNQGTV